MVIYTDKDNTIFSIGSSSEIDIDGVNIFDVDGLEFNELLLGAKFIDNKIIYNTEKIKKFEVDIVNSDYSIATQTMISGVPIDEVSTFPIQKEEAKAWFKDNTESTPFIDGMLISRTDLTKEHLVDKILAKAEAYAYAAGMATGDRQMKEKQILEGEI